MQLRADFSERVVLDTASMPWTPSPQAGVERRMLDRVGGEVARATSLVRYAPSSSFPAHTHGMGEEFLVLEGTFHDEHGAYPAGTYVRNPWGTQHAPFTREGCVILVRLRQMLEGDTTRVVVDTRDASFAPGSDEGVAVCPLHTFGDEHVSLERWTAGARPARHDHPGGAEVFVIEGTFADDEGRYPTGAWLRFPPESTHAPWSDAGCLLWVKRGHLPASP